DKGDQITVEVTPNDGTVNGTTATSDTATVINTAPVIDSVAINETSPTTNQTLHVTVTSHDVDSDTVTYTYQWFKTGTAISGATSSTLDLNAAGNGSKADAISVQVTPNDGTVNGSAVTSPAVTIANSAPVIDSANIDETSPT